MKKTVGIVGGVGPLSTADFLEKIISMTRASCDQEHLHVIVDNNPSVPDRTEAILCGGESPVPAFVRSIQLLKTAGAEIFAMPCCTAHSFLREIEAQADVKFVDMLQTTAQILSESGIERVGLLATNGLLKTGHFSNVLSDFGIETFVPYAEEQRAVTDMIYKTVKAGCWQREHESFLQTAQSLLQRGAQVLILGCTELPVAFSHYQIDLPYIDTALVLAAAVVMAAGGELRSDRPLISW